MVSIAACGMTAMDIAEKETPSPPPTQSKRSRKDGHEKSRLEEKVGLRAWIHSVFLSPARVNKDESLKALTDWGPTGRPEMALHYEWFVNEQRVSSGASSRLALSEFRSGDRVYVVSKVLLKQGLLKEESVLASRRSRSIVIQNRPPRLEAGLKEMRQENDMLVGQIKASDPDGDFFTMRLLEGPRGLSLSPDGDVRWPLSEVMPGAQQLVIELEDERGLGFRGTLPFWLRQEHKG